MKAIKNWAPEDRPRERLLANGAGSLSKAELLAILIGSGVPGKSAVDIMRNILSDYGAGGLIVDENSSTSYSVVLAVPGIDRIFLHFP